MRPSLIIIIFALLLAACRREPAEPLPALARAESVMEEHPDSALSILAGIDTAATSPADRALHALLQAEALDKCGVPVASDSVAAPAVAFFDERRQPLRAAMALYYLGRARYNAQLYASSLTAMLSAHAAAKRAGDDFWIAMTARGISENFNKTYNPAQEREYAIIAYNHFRAAKRPLHAAYGLLDIAISQFNSREWKECCTNLRDVIAQSDTLNNIDLYKEAASLYSQALLMNGCYEQALGMAESLSAKNMSSSEDSIVMAIAYARTGQPQEAKNILRTTKHTDDQLSKLLQFDLYQLENNTDKALSTILEINKNNNQIVSSGISNNLTSIMVEFHLKNMALQEDKLSLSRKLLRTSIFCSVCILAIICIIFLWYKHKRVAMIERNLTVALELNERYLSQHSNSQQKISNLATSHFDLFDNLCNILYESADSKTGRKRVAECVENMISVLSSDSKEFDKLVGFVDANMDSAASELREAIPGINEINFKVFIYSAIGFSINTISLFINATGPTSVYNRKRHIKDDIKRLESPLREKLIALI